MHTQKCFLKKRNKSLSHISIQLHLQSLPPISICLSRRIQLTPQSSLIFAKSVGTLRSSCWTAELCTPLLWHSQTVLLCCVPPRRSEASHSPPQLLCFLPAASNVAVVNMVLLFFFLRMVFCVKPKHLGEINMLFQARYMCLYAHTYSSF